jgi:hypothetical protein
MMSALRVVAVAVMTLMLSAAGFCFVSALFAMLAAIVLTGLGLAFAAFVRAFFISHGKRSSNNLGTLYPGLFNGAENHFHFKSDMSMRQTR